MRKKMVAVVLAAAMVCSLAACGGNETAAPEATQEGTEEAAPAADEAEAEPVEEETAEPAAADETAAAGLKIGVAGPLIRTITTAFSPLLRSIPTAR